MYATQRLAQAAVSLHQHPLPAHVLHHAKRAVIDWYASLYPGLSVAPVPQLVDVLSEDLDRGSSWVGVGRSATAKAASLLNGTAAHAAEVDDSFREAMYHPGAATIAGALAAAHEHHATGQQFLRAVVTGYEVSTRIGVAMGRPHYTHWHNTGTIGTFGAAASVGTLLQLDEAGMAHALATAATFAAGLQQAFRMDSMSKPLHAGRAAEAGLLAAQLAARGVTGSLDVLDGEAGLGAAMSEGVDWSQVASTLGQDFHITRLTFKNHIGCGHTFAAIDAALELRQQHACRPDEIAEVHVATYKPALDIACYQQPTTLNEARFSLSYVVATALTHGSVRLAAYEADRVDHPETRALMQRTTVSVDPALDAAFPAQRAARVTLLMRGGTRLEHLQANRKGDPELPLSDQELNDKYLELASPVIGQASAQALLTQLWHLEELAELPR